MEFNEIINNRSNIRDLLVKGAGWQVLFRFSGRFLGLAKNIVLARFLSPGDIGTMGIALICLEGIERVTYLSIHNVLLWKADERHNYTKDALIVSVGRGVMISIFLFLFASSFGALLKSDRAVSIIRAISLIPLIDSLINPGLVDLRYELNFKKLGIYEFITDLITASSTVVLAWRLQSPWAIAIGMILGRISYVLVSYYLVRFVSTAQWSWARIKEIIHYGKWVSANGLVQFAAGQFDSIVVARMMGATELGFYKMADQFSRVPFGELTAILLRLTTPAFTRLQRDTGGMLALVLRTIGFIGYILFPIVITFLVAGDYLISWFLGPAWLRAIPILKVLMIGGMMIAFQSTGGPIFYALGVPKEDFRIYATRATAMMILSVPLVILSGAIGAAFAVILSSAAVFPIWFYQLRRYAMITIGQIVREIMIPLIISIILGVVLLFGIHLCGTNILMIILLIIMIGIIYGIILVIFARYYKTGPLEWIFHLSHKQ